MKCNGTSEMTKRVWHDKQAAELRKIAAAGQTKILDGSFYGLSAEEIEVIEDNNK